MYIVSMVDFPIALKGSGMTRKMLAAAALAATALAAAPSAALAKDHHRGGYNAGYAHGSYNRHYRPQPRWSGNAHGAWGYNQQWQGNGHNRGHDRRAYTARGHDGYYAPYGYAQRHGGGHY